MCLNYFSSLCILTFILYLLCYKILFICSQEYILFNPTSPMQCKLWIILFHPLFMIGISALSTKWTQWVLVILFLLIVTMSSRSYDTVVLAIWIYLNKGTRDWNMGMLGDSWQSQGNSGNGNLCLNS